MRHQVLWPHKPPEFTIVPDDETAWHFGAYNDGQLVCVASLFPDGQSIRLRKFATLAEFQGQGIGSQMLSHLLDYAAEHGMTRFWCDARESAMGMYQKFGFAPEGERFFKAEVPYFVMAKAIDPA